MLLFFLKPQFSLKQTTVFPAESKFYCWGVFFLVDNSHARLSTAGQEGN